MLIDAQYIEDAVLIENYIGNNFRGPLLFSSASPLAKIAGVKEVFQTVADSIFQEVLKLWDPNDPLKSIVNFTATGLVTIFGPWWLGLIYTICSEFLGVDFGTLFDKVRDIIAGTLKEKRSIGAQDITSAVSQAVGGFSAMDHVTAKQTERLFRKLSYLQDHFKNESIYQYNINKQAGVGSFVLAPFKALLKKVVSPPMAKSFIGKVLSFIFKTMIISVAKAKAGAAGRSLVGGTSSSGETSPGIFQSLVSQVSSSGPKFVHKMKPTSFGITNQPGNWEEDFGLSDLENHLVDWATQRYPELNSHRDEILQSKSFQDTAKAIKENNSRNHYNDVTYIPHKINGQNVNSQADIVELFAGEAAQKAGI